MEENKENNFGKNYLVQITNELYRLTLLFPKKEPLRYKMRELSDDVLANFVSLPQEDNNPTKIKIVKDSKKMIEVLDSFFDIVKTQDWVRASDILNLQEEYSKIGEELLKFQEEEKIKKARKQEEKIDDEVREISILKKEEEKPISERQKKLLKVLEEKGKMQVWEIKDIFSEVSKRTLRRDFRSLLKNGLVERIGERNNTFYQIKGRTESI
ncbi:MAG: DeoR family transcriptional regulator [Candidatus Nealsonbacteria bacterium]|nr:MAG: DeoR family transcriptional regulator [Candidatus Nealsonbacteria bacterium]